MGSKCRHTSVFFFKQKTACEISTRDWSSDVCSSDLVRAYTGEMTGLNRAPGTVTDDVLALSAELSEHLITPDELAAWTGRFFAAVQELPGRVYKDVADALARQRHR